MTSSEWDCVIVGGGAAGLSAALVLGRARQRTLLLDGGRQSNLAAEGIGGLLGSDHRPPAEFYAAGRAELAPYPSVEPRDLEVVDGAPAEPGFTLELEDGSEQRARTVLLATGMDYRYPDLPGARERWGHSVFHCPFCHGWEVRDRPLAVFGADDAAVHRALLLRNWSESVTLLSNGAAELPDDARDHLARAGVEVDERPLAALRGEGRELAGIGFADGSERACEGLLVPITLERRSPLPERLGARRAEPTLISSEGIEVDATQNAGVPGLYAAGDLVPKAPSVAAAVASGSLAAAAIVHALAG
jgi:thioredoxin reductase